MSADNPVRPCIFRDRIKIGINVGLKRKCVPGAIQQRKIQWHVKSGPLATVEMPDAVRLALHFSG